MPRSARLDAPGVLHHVTIRGIRSRSIFKDDRDRENFLERLGKLLQETRTACYAWALLPDHAHLLLRTGSVPLATVMRRLLTGYVVSFNHRHRRHGELLQDRYKSVVCQKNPYLKELVRYIHLNPLRRGITLSLAKLSVDACSGHSAILGNKKRPWQDVGFVLHSFGKSAGHARRSYLTYLKAGIGQGRRDDLTGGGLIRSPGSRTEIKRIRSKGNRHVKGDERILGDSKFVDTVLAKAKERRSHQKELRRRGYDLKRVADRVARVLGSDVKQIYAVGRQQDKVKARDLYCFWAVRELGVSLTDLARRLGMSPPGVGYAVRRGEAIAQKKRYRLAA